MTNTPWKTDKWFTSPWNHMKEVTSEFKFPAKIKIHDITLRDGEQQAGIVFNRKDKVNIAKRLAEIGVQRIEAGMPVVSPQDEAAVKEIVDLGLKSEIFAFSRCMVSDVRKAKECGVKGIVIEIPCSEHIIKYAYGWELERAIKLSIEATLCAKEEGLYTVFFTIDASRAEMSWYLDLVEKVATEGHMDALALVDTLGVLSPHAIPYYVKKVRERIDKPLEAHFHRDYGLAVANTIMALSCGVEVAHTTITGIGERAGNASLEELVMALLTLYGIDLSIKTEGFFELSKFIRKLSKIDISVNRPIVGEKLYNIESGISASWARKLGEENLLELIPFKPSLVGGKDLKIVLGKKSGIDSVAMLLEKMNVRATEDQSREILALLKEKGIKKKTILKEEEAMEIVRDVVGKG